jgi:hypothetical protein
VPTILCRQNLTAALVASGWSGPGRRYSSHGTGAACLEQSAVQISADGTVVSSELPILRQRLLVLADLLSVVSGCSCADFPQWIELTPGLSRSFCGGGFHGKSTRYKGAALVCTARFRGRHGEFCSCDIGQRHEDSGEDGRCVKSVDISPLLTTCRLGKTQVFQHTGRVVSTESSDEYCRGE